MPEHHTMRMTPEFEAMLRKRNDDLPTGAARQVTVTFDDGSTFEATVKTKAQEDAVEQVMATFPLGEAVFT